MAKITKKSTVAKAKAQVKTPPKPGSKINSLPKEQVEAIEAMLVDGKSCKAVAAIILDEFGAFQGSSPEAVERMLYRYRKRYVDPKYVIKAHDIDPEERRIVLCRAAKNVDVLQELSELAEVQKSRLKQLIELEAQVLTATANNKKKKGSNLVSGLKREIEELREIYELIADLQVKTGILKTDPANNSINFNVSGAESKVDKSFRLRMQVTKSAITVEQILKSVDGQGQSNNGDVIDV